MTQAVNLAEMELQACMRKREKKRKIKIIALLKIINGKGSPADVKALN